MTSAEVRNKLAHALNLDLVGPERDTVELHSETLPQPPSRWYLAGFLVPIDADESQRSDETGDEGLEEQGDTDDSDDAAAPEAAPARRAFFASSMGMSFLIPKETKELRVAVRWGDYKPLTDPSANPEQPKAKTEATDTHWQRTERVEVVPLKTDKAQRLKETAVPNSDGLKVVLSVRPVKDIPQFKEHLPSGTRSVSVFLVNRRDPKPDVVRDAGFVFQASLTVQSEAPFVPRQNLRGLDSNDRDERVADLQYRDAFEFAVGHNVSTHAVMKDSGDCHELHTRWIPNAEVERVAPADIADVELRMEELAQLPDAATAQAKLSALSTQYRAWIEVQKAKVPTKQPRRKEVADDLLNQANTAATRIESGIQLLANPQVLEAFRLANKVMADAARQRFGVMRGRPPEAVDSPTWRPFQLAFVLMNLKGIAEPGDLDRKVVDLLFFPTGGGKTEAYLGLASFTLILRRLRNPGIASAGLSVLMRYTLRLLTLDQLGRAATLICALERVRQADVTKLGEWPFEIGLWVGKAATPNEMGRKGDGKKGTARERTIAYKNNDHKPSPIPLEECPWCGTRFTKDSFHLHPNADLPSNLRIVCVNRKCAFTKNNPLPILAVDEPIYRRLPCFMIATVDKFAAMPWTGPVGGFFGRVERHDKGGFYGPCEPNVGVPIPGGSLPPPDLVIQDELHLISGPMGTMVGLYESALDELCARKSGENTIRPKIVASTATVRRAEKQIKALFNRDTVDIFPPPGPDRRDSFFARTHTTAESNARLYLGVAAQGRSPKVILLRTYLALLGAAQKWYVAAGGEKVKDNPADPYMTLLGYFNSLRELGGSRRIVEDEVSTRITAYSKRRRNGETESLFADREVDYEVVELTSRVSTDKVAEAKARLQKSFAEDKCVDIAIATNMISVGLDISRLGLMVVLGQPKTAAEYIQTTSRVGRDVRGDAAKDKPGLVITIMNVHRPRDRSHYERFSHYHQSFYRSVEATSVTPFSPRALDRGLAGTLVALARQGHRPMTAPKGASEILQERAKLEWVAKALAQRAANFADEAVEAAALQNRVLERANDLLDAWVSIAKDYQDKNVVLQYQQEEGSAKRLLYDFLNPELKTLPLRHHKFRANRSMRDVEPSVNLWLQRFNGTVVEDEG